MRRYVLETDVYSLNLACLALINLQPCLQFSVNEVLQEKKNYKHTTIENNIIF